MSPLPIRVRLTAAALALAGLAGCGPVGEVALLAPAPPTRFREAAARPAPPVRMDWLAGFGSSELATLGRQALAGNFDVEAAAARIDQAEALARAAAAALYPQLDASADASRSRSPGTLRSASGPFEASIGNRFGLGLSASYILDFWGRNRATARAAEQDAVA
ncbi:MAG TPA: TolC family protein, partial [Beijerinckiaceae bacterium]